MRSEGEVCATAEDQGMRMGCGFEGKEVQNGSIVYVGNVEDNDQMG